MLDRASDRLVTLAAATVRGYADAALASSTLVASGPNTRATLVRIWDITGHDGDAVDSEFAAETAAGPDVPAAARRVAAERVAAWTDVWESAELQPDHSDDPDDVYDVRHPIVEHLVAAARDIEILSAVSDGLPTIVGHLEDDETAETLLDGVAATAKRLLTEGNVEMAGQALRKVVEAAGCDRDLLDAKARLLLDPISTQNDTADPHVAMAVRLVASVADTSDGPEVLSAIAAEWRDLLRHSGPHDGRAVIEGFKALPEDLGGIIEENAPLVLQDLRSHIERQDDPADRLRTMATFPWPVALRPEAVGVIDADWDNVADDTRLPAFDIFARTELDAGTQARFHDRLIAAVQADPFGSVTRVAVDVMHRMSKRNRADLYIAAGGKHADVTQAWIEAEEVERAETIAEFTRDAGTAKRLFESLPQALRAEMSRASLIKIATIPDVAAQVVPTVASYARPQDLDAAAQAALMDLEQDAPTLVSALRVLHDARACGARLETRKITAAAVVHLPEASPIAGELFGLLIDVKTLGRTLQGVLKEMEQGSERARAAAEAFRAARLRRRRR